NALGPEKPRSHHLSETSRRHSGKERLRKEHARKPAFRQCSPHFGKDLYRWIRHAVDRSAQPETSDRLCHADESPVLRADLGKRILFRRLPRSRTNGRIHLALSVRRIREPDPKTAEPSSGRRGNRVIWR